MPNKLSKKPNNLAVISSHNTPPIAAPALESSSSQPVKGTRNGRIQFKWNWATIIALLALLVSIIGLLHQLGLVPASPPIPLECAIPADTANHEILVVITQFQQMSGDPLQPGDEWTQTLQLAINQLHGKVRARVCRVSQVISTDQDARTIADNYKATLVIWGSVGAMSVSSNYAITPRWSYIVVAPGNTRTAEMAQPIDTLDKLRLFVSRGGETEYVLNFVLAQLTFYGDNHFDALPFLNKALALLPQDPLRNEEAAAIYFDRAIIYNDQGKFDLALADFTQDITLAPKDVPAFINRGNIYGAKGNHDLQLADYNQAVALDPNNAIAYSNRGDVYIDQGKFDLALTDLTQAMALDPKFAAPHNNRGFIYYSRGKLDQALEDFKQAIALDPKDAPAYRGYGAVYATQGKLEQALNVYNQAVNLEPDFPDGYFVRGDVYKTQGNNAKALSDFQRYLDLGGTDPTMRATIDDFKAKLGLATAATSSGN